MDHTLVDQLAERLILTNISQIEQELVPETGINEVASGVLGATNVEINIPPICVHILVNQGVIIVGIHVAEIIGT